MDQEEFEMKPLTPGLGFHKRQVSLKEHIAKAGVADQNLRRSLPAEPPAEMLEKSYGSARSSKEIIAELHQALKPIQKKNSLRMTETLPRDISDVRLPKTPIAPEIGPERKPEGGISRGPLSQIDFQITDKVMNEGVRRSAHDGKNKPLVAISVSFASIALDAVIILALSLIFLVSLVTVTGVDIVSVVHSTQNEFATQLSLLVLYLAVLEMYVIVSRSFFGSTVGEWTFDLQMGETEQIARAAYPALVLWRSMVNLLTGVIFLPLFSFLLKTDLAAKFTGLQLYKKNI